MKFYVKIYDQVLQHATLSFISASLWHLPQLESQNNTGRVNGLQWPWHRHRENKSEKFQYNRVTTSCPQTQTKSQKPFCMFKTCFKGLFRSKMSLYPNSMSTLHPIRLSIHSAGIFVTIVLVRSMAVVSSFVIMPSHLITNRMRFYFFQSKCVVNVSSACHFPTRGGMQCKIVRRSLSFPRSKFENFMGYSCFMGYPWCLLGHIGLVKD